jgi:hypothetical protein
MTKTPDRRAFLRRGAALTAVVWTAPAVTTMGPSAFASPGTPRPGEITISEIRVTPDSGGVEHVSWALEITVDWGGLQPGVFIWSSSSGEFYWDDPGDRHSVVFVVTRSDRNNPITVWAYAEALGPDGALVFSRTVTQQLSVICEPYLPSPC